jgi:hypothetical protein
MRAPTTTPKVSLLREGILICLCLLVLWGAFAMRTPVYFRDYSITFEGALRLYLGQIPYRDFGSPVGPFSFVIPALLFKLISPSWTVFMFAQQLINGVMLLLVNALLLRIGVREAMRWVSLGLFTALYLLLLTHPWYNSTGTMLLLAASLCAMGSGRLRALGAGLLSGLAILTKQDFGAVTVLIAGFMVALANLGSDFEKILPYWHYLRDPRRLRAAARSGVVFALATIAPVALFVYATDPTQFAYWFNYGQAPHQHRGVTLNDLVGNTYGHLALLIAALALVRNNFRLLIVSIFITAASVTRTTSGLGFTHYYFIAFLPLMIDECLRITIRFKPLLLALIVYAGLRLISHPATDAYHVVEAIIKRQPEHFFFDYRLNSKLLVPVPEDLHAFSPHTLMPQETIDAIRFIKQKVRSRRAIASTPAPISVLNMTELTPIYAELGVEPPRQWPLWFHTRVSLFPQQISDLTLTLAGNEYDFVLLQGTHEGMTPTYRAFLATLQKNSKYRLIQTINDTPADTTWHCAPNCEGKIYIFEKL